MFKNLSIFQVAEIVMYLINDQSEDIAGLKGCFEILFNESKKPKYRYRDFDDVVMQANQYTLSKLICFDNTPDYLFNNISKEISTDQLAEILELCLTTDKVLQTAWL